jgi:urease subunit beta
VIPGEIIPGPGEIEINPGRTPIRVTVHNTGDRPVQVGSHFHFAESNAALDFDRDAAWGHRLAVAAGTSVRFEPGMPRDVSLIPLAGRRIVPGLRGLAAGPLDTSGPFAAAAPTTPAAAPTTPTAPTTPAAAPTTPAAVPTTPTAPTTPAATLTTPGSAPDVSAPPASAPTTEPASDLPAAAAPPDTSDLSVAPENSSSR